MALLPPPRVGALCSALLATFVAHLARADTGGWLPAKLPPPPEAGPALCQRDFLTPAQGAAVLQEAAARFSTAASWQAYASHVRLRVQEGAGLAPWPRRTPLNAVLRGRRVHDGYSVENVAFESVPGYFVTGNVYRPLGDSGTAGVRFPVVLATHGHARKIERPEDYDGHARFSPSMQARCAGLARLGAIVLSIDMVGMGDSIPQVGQDAHARPFSLTLQLWNALRAVDLLLTLDGADPTRVAVTGESGGGTQAFLLAALDPRVTVGAPVVMVSSYFFGGCPCESGLPIHRSADHFASNALLAALTAPRPQLVVSDGKDWTRHVPEVEYPFLQHVYGLLGAAEAVANVHFPTEGHDFGPSKREAVARFLAARWGLGLASMQGADGGFDESRLTIERAGPLHVFTDDFPLPARALRDIGAVEATLRNLQR